MGYPRAGKLWGDGLVPVYDGQEDELIEDGIELVYTPVKTLERIIYVCRIYLARFIKIAELVLGWLAGQVLLTVRRSADRDG